MSIKNTPSTRLKGFEMFISNGIQSGEIDVGMTVVDLLNLMTELMIEKEKPFEKKMNGLGDDYAY